MGVRRREGGARRRRLRCGCPHVKQEKQKKGGGAWRRSRRVVACTHRSHASGVGGAALMGPVTAPWHACSCLPGPARGRPQAAVWSEPPVQAAATAKAGTQRRLSTVRRWTPVPLFLFCAMHGAIPTLDLDSCAGAPATSSHMDVCTPAIVVGWITPAQLDPPRLCGFSPVSKVPHAVPPCPVEDANLLCHLL